MAQANRRLTKQQQTGNTTRAWVEHVFARIDRFRQDMPMGCNGLHRAIVWLGVVNLTYNLRRLLTMQRIAMGMT